MHRHCSFVCSAPHMERCVHTRWNLHLMDWLFCWDFKICGSVASPNFKCLAGGEISKQLEGRGKTCTSAGTENEKACIVIWIAAGSGTRNQSWTWAQDSCGDSLCLGAEISRPEPEQTERRNSSYPQSWQSRWQGLPHSPLRNKDFLVWIWWGSSEEERTPVCQEQWHSSQERGSSRGQDSPKAGFNKGLWIWLWF